MGMMKFGLFGINNGPLADPDASVRAAQAAEAAGFDSVWTGEHVVLPDPQEPPAPAPPHVPMLDPAVALAYLAAHTSTIALGHRDHHPPAAQSARVGQGAGERRRGVEGPALVRLRRWLPAPGVRRVGHPVRRPRRPLRRVPRRDARAVGQRVADVRRRDRSLQRDRRAPAARATAAPPADRRRPEPTGVPASRAPRQRVVRVRHATRRRGTVHRRPRAGQPAKPTGIRRSANSNSRSPRLPAPSMPTRSTSTGNSVWLAS